MEIKSNNKYEVLTEEGFSDFKSIKKTFHKKIKIITLKTNNNEISCTAKHKIQTDKGYRQACRIKKNSLIMTNTGLEKIIGIFSEIKKKVYVYDLIEVEKGNHYYANDILVSNCEEFMQSVYPVVSSSKNSQIIMVSTPNGTGNEFYEIYTRASLGIDPEGWKAFRMDWWDFPGRDDEWKKLQLASFGGDNRKFSQEYGNAFVGSAYTLLSANKLNELIKAGKEQSSYEQFNVGGFEKFALKVYKRPEQGRVYVVGADTGDGCGKDFSTILVLDITELSKIEIVAAFGNNLIPTSEFAFLLCKVATLFNKAYICLERNGIGKAIIDALWDVYEYENIFIYDTTGQQKLGIFSHNAVKTNACNWMRDLFNFDEVHFKINENQLIYELQSFERKVPSQNVIYQAAGGKNDDYTMAFIWALWILHATNVDTYFIVRKKLITKMGIEIPYILGNYNNSYYDENYTESNMQNIDSLFEKNKLIQRSQKADTLPHEKEMKKEMKELRKEMDKDSTDYEFEDTGKDQEEPRFIGFANF